MTSRDMLEINRRIGAALARSDYHHAALYYRELRRYYAAIRDGRNEQRMITMLGLLWLEWARREGVL